MESRNCKNFTFIGSYVFLDEYYYYFKYIIDNFDLATKLSYGAISLLREAYINDETKLDYAYFILAECHYVSKKYDTAKEFLVKVLQLKL